MGCGGCRHERTRTYQAPNTFVERPRFSFSRLGTHPPPFPCIHPSLMCIESALGPPSRNNGRFHLLLEAEPSSRVPQPRFQECVPEVAQFGGLCVQLVLPVGVDRAIVLSGRVLSFHFDVRRTTKQTRRPWVARVVKGGCHREKRGGGASTRLLCGSLLQAPASIHLSINNNILWSTHREP